MRWHSVLILAILGLGLGIGPAVGAEAKVQKVEIVETGQGFQLLRGGQPFTIRGAGLEYGDIASLAAHGGNAIRNWTTDNAAEVLDTALANGVAVALCLPVSPERSGFDYGDEAAVAEQLQRMREEVLKYRDHPALLAWIIGNELNFDYTDSRVYDAVNDIARMIHEVDPNHPATTTVAGIGENVLQDLETRAPDLDFLSFQVYGEVFNLRNFIRDNPFERPVWVTEWGAIGHWEVEKTSWGAPIEMTSTEKASVYYRAHNDVLQPLEGKSLGTFAFLWGQKQERTSTWFGMFTEAGEETEVVDVMHRIWTGQWPANRSPQVRDLTIAGRSARDSIVLEPGTEHDAVVTIADPDGDDISYRWELKPESQTQQVGGDREARIENVDSGLDAQRGATLRLQVPLQPGAYRLFVYAYDGNNHAAHANVPFLVRE